VNKFSTSYEKLRKQVLAPKEETRAEIHEAPVEIDVQGLNAAWASIVAQAKTERKAALATTLERYHPEQVSAGSLKIVAVNSRDFEHLQEQKLELVATLKKQLGVRSLELQLEVKKESAAEATELKPYTDRDKFEAMAKKNPALLKLKEKLDLDFEY
jgi:hypothetical protein